MLCRGVNKLYVEKFFSLRFFTYLCTVKMRADPRPPGADIESQSVIRHGDEHPAW